MIAFCPLCSSDEYTSLDTDPDGKQFAQCSNAKEHGADGYAWIPSSPSGSERGTRSDGLGIELGVWDKLLECVPTDGEFHSYGEVEDTFFALYPREASTLQNRYGHRWREGAKSDGTYSMSVYLALRLSELRREGVLEATWLPAGGELAYNDVISHWRVRWLGAPDRHVIGSQAHLTADPASIRRAQTPLSGQAEQSGLRGRHQVRPISHAGPSRAPGRSGYACRAIAIM